jgi:HK97 family phage portal protein
VEIFGLSITRASRTKGVLSAVSGSGGWWPLIRESYTGAWQENAVEVRLTDVLTYSTVYACVSLIASDISKMRLRLVQLDTNGIWREAENPAYSPVLRKPNHYQTRIKFVEWWITSKLLNGNAYILKERDGRGVVRALYVLDPTKVTPLVSDTGDVFYQIRKDNLSGLRLDEIIVPATEIIHDVMYALYHPLVGVSPIHACGLAAMQGLAIQNNSTRFFSNGSTPGGVLTAPAAISKDTADRVKAYWDSNFTGENVGKVAVLGDGLKYEPMSVKAVDAQLIEQLKWTSENVCSAFHVPAYKVGIGAPPTYNNIEALDRQYYSQCLQGLIESLELTLDEGLAVAPGLGTEFDLDDLLRMDSATMIDAEAKAVGAGIKAPNESRRRLNLAPVKGGESPYLQQQNYSLAALSRRDAGDPFAPKVAPRPAELETPSPDRELEAAGLEAFDPVTAWNQKAAAVLHGA